VSGILLIGELMNVCSWCCQQVLLKHPCTILVILSLLCISCVIGSVLVLGIPNFQDPQLASTNHCCTVLYYRETILHNSKQRYSLYIPAEHCIEHNCYTECLENILPLEGEVSLSGVLTSCKLVASTASNYGINFGLC